jgi:L-lactate utilization protein LutB
VIILYTALAMQIPIFFFFFVFGLIMRRRIQLLSCMECQRCTGSCPVLKKHPEFIGPYGVMVAAKRDRYDLVEQGHLELCTQCGLCAEACPRKLDALAEAANTPYSVQHDKVPDSERVISLGHKKRKPEADRP